MQLKDQALQERALEGADDFKTIVASIQRLGTVLSPRYNLFINMNPNRSHPVTASQAWYEIFEQRYEDAKERHMLSLRENGIRFASFEEHCMSLGSKSKIVLLNNRFKLAAWINLRGKLLEVLCLLTVLSTSDSKGFQNVNNVMAKVGPIRIIDEGAERFVWTQPTLKETISGFRAQPDIVITNSDRVVSSETIVHVIECKNIARFASSLIRSEFGKAHDLKVSSYAIVSFYEVQSKIVQAARRLGLDLYSIGLYSAKRQRYISGEVDLAHDLAKKLENSTEQKRFLALLDESSRSAHKKLLPPNY